MRTVFFGTSCNGYDRGRSPACAINSTDEIIEVHRSGEHEGLWYRLGNLDGSEVSLPIHGPIRNLDAASDAPDPGHNPSVGLNASGLVVEAHDSGSGELFCVTGRTKPDGIAWLSHARFDHGYKPSVTIDDSGLIVEVHQAGLGVSDLSYTLGRLAQGGSAIAWQARDSLRFAGSETPARGQNPAIALNENGLIVEVHDGGDGTLWYWIGRLATGGGGGRIDWLGHDSYEFGITPSVALGDDGSVIEVHQSPDEATLWVRRGDVEVRGDTAAITWSDPFRSTPPRYSYYFDDGRVPNVAFNGRVAVQVHASPAADRLWTSASLSFDRSGWLNEHLTTRRGEPLLRDRPLAELVLPASHDAGAYEISRASARTQDLSVLSQLMSGCRYFDLRPRRRDGRFVIHHGRSNGPPLRHVLADVREFLDQHRELVVLKFSHFDGFARQEVWDQFTAEVLDILDVHLYDAPRPAPGERLAERTLGEFIQSGKPCLALCAAPYPGAAGGVVPDNIWKYRDWYDDDASGGHVTVFDVWSHTSKLAEMRDSREPDPNHPELPRGQLPKFEQFDGRCKDGTPCDLFLWSWTLTSRGRYGPTDTPNAGLGRYVPAGGTSRDRMINLLYCDYVQYARSSDIALLRNGCWSRGQPAGRASSRRSTSALT